MKSAITIGISHSGKPVIIASVDTPTAQQIKAAKALAASKVNEEFREVSVFEIGDSSRLKRFKFHNPATGEKIAKATASAKSAQITEAGEQMRGELLSKRVEAKADLARLDIELGDDEPKADEPKADEPKADEPKADEPKAYAKKGKR
tara:strand:- start:1409 stop:1852 length:444 start_codon:yes stop_codon:yes gene_type:complete